MTKHKIANANARRKSVESGRVRLEDVAAVVGVSLASVSRAFKRPDLVSEELRTRIMKASERLGFRPSALAGSLASARSSIVGVIVPTFRTSIFAETLEAMDAALSPSGYQMTIGHHEHDLDRELALISGVLDWMPAAIVVTGTYRHRNATLQLASARCPVVEMWDMSDSPIDSVIGFSHRDVGRQAARHLIERGRKRLAFVAGGTMTVGFRTTARVEGFLEAVAEAGLPRPRVVSLSAPSTTIGGVRAMSELLDGASRGALPDGIAFSSDPLALGGLFEAQRHGIKVPEDIAIIGYGDMQYAAFISPPLTTIRPPHRLIGEAVGKHLLHRFSNPDAGSQSLDLGFELVVRATT